MHAFFIASIDDSAVLDLLPSLEPGLPIQSLLLSVVLWSHGILSTSFIFKVDFRDLRIRVLDHALSLSLSPHGPSVGCFDAAHRLKFAVASQLIPCGGFVVLSDCQLVGLQIVMHLLAFFDIFTLGYFILLVLLIDDCFQGFHEGQDFLIAAANGLVRSEGLFWHLTLLRWILPHDLGFLECRDVKVLPSLHGLVTKSEVALQAGERPEPKQSIRILKSILIVLLAHLLLGFLTASLFRLDDNLVGILAFLSFRLLLGHLLRLLVLLLLALSDLPLFFFLSLDRFLLLQLVICLYIGNFL